MRTRRQNGIALLAVLWLTVALSAMALATSYLVRTEVEAVTNRIDGEQMKFLARGGIEAAVDSILRSTITVSVAVLEGRERPEFELGQRWLRYDFPGGRCAVEVVPENAKLNVNQAPAEQLAVLFRMLHLPVIESAELALAIDDWRQPRISPQGNAFDAYYAMLEQPYLARHTPLGHLEELFPVKGMSREIFFGRMERVGEDEWLRTPPLADLLTVAPVGGGINVNYAAREVLQTLPGWNEQTALRVIEARERRPLQALAELGGIVAPDARAGATTAPLPFYTLTATCTHPDSGTRRSVRALVEITARQLTGYQVLGWWNDWPYANEDPAERQSVLQAGKTVTKKGSRA